MEDISNQKHIPGTARYTDICVKGSVEPPFCSELKNLQNRPIIFLATAFINDDNLFSNGLYQNVYLLYRMFEAMGYLSVLFINQKPTTLDKIPKYMRNIRIISGEDLSKSPIPVKFFVEIGMSVDENMHRFLKMLGARLCKLYLGNILNIDIETPIFMPDMYFAHHVKGLMDEIWVSPHYAVHAEYARALNNVSLEKKTPIVVPYIWDPQILTADGERKFSWRPPTGPSEDTFLILEPNISFQKCSLVPLLMIEAWFRKNPEWKGKVILTNGERLMLIPFFRESVWNNLELVKAGRVETQGRMSILKLLEQHPSAIPVCWQMNNEYNYMVLEYMWSGFPVLHNSGDWDKYGYYYGSIEEGVKQIETIRRVHYESLEIFKAGARQLAWNLSPYNPSIHKKWGEVLGDSHTVQGSGHASQAAPKS